MTNEQIIFNESRRLLKEGILKSTGFVDMINEDGTKTKIELPEPIHTFQTWKSLGYNVKKGEKAIAKFPIWKHTSKTVTDEETNEERERTAMYMKTAAFFKFSQVEKIEEKAV